MNRRFRSPFFVLKNNRGVALLIAIFSSLMMMFIAVETSYETTIEYRVAAQQVNRLKAYYAAKAGMELSILRLLIFKKALAKYGEQLGEKNKSKLDPIWQIPFSWPPLVPEDISRVDKELIGDAVKDSLMQSQYIVTIGSEGSKIDINDLDSKSQGLRDSTKKQLLQIFENYVDTNVEWAQENREFDPEKVVNNMIDWIDADDESLNGGREDSAYDNLDVDSEFIPPNQAFKTVEELHMVAGMKDEIFAILANRITTYGVKGINVNYANKDVLKSIDPNIDDEMAKLIVEARNDPNQEPFSTSEQLAGFVGLAPTDFNPNKIPLHFDTELNFRIIATGRHANSTRQIVAIVYDFDKVKDRLAKIVKDEEDEKKKEDGQSPTTPADPKADDKKKDDKKQAVIPNGRPNVVYWFED